MGISSVGTIGQSAIKAGIGSIIFGTGYGLFTRVGHEGLGAGIFGPRNRNSYSSRYPTKFKLPYYRYSNNRYGSRYGRRYGRRYSSRYSRYSRFGQRKRFFSRYRTRRMY